ncbi:PhzF family phenazine biosynthesis protein [Roseibium sp.]|uniref:PhzF family phenazine biosynthesis protein n=1 Tax=Roseibium sp. TaxID=1936156 RepID=UPI00326355FA
METLPVRLYAAFAADETGGNMSAAVFEDMPLWPAARRRIAADLGAPVTGFVRQLAGDRFETKFLSPFSEIDMSGHGAVAVFSALRDDGRIGPGAFVLETESGEIAVDVAPEGSIALRQPLPDFTTSAPGSAELASLLGVTASAVVKVSAASLGHRLIFVQLADPETLAAIHPETTALDGYCRARSVDGIGVWWPAFSGLGKMKIRLRAFRRGAAGFGETAGDTTSAALACTLLRSHSLLPGAGGQAVLVAEQGAELCRPSIVRTVLNTLEGEITGVSVGGYAALRMTGEVVV